MDTILINGEEYVKKTTCAQLTPAPKVDGMQYTMVRTYSAGVFAGYLKSHKGKEVVLLNARRIWQWYGAASLSQLATDGTSEPKSCKFPVAVSEVTLTEAIELIPITAKAKASIDSVPVWSK